jgi:hypothetical protein
MARQALIRRVIDPPALQVALNESALRWPVGGGSIMAAQLDRLAEAARLPNVSLRVVPFSAGFHPGILSGSFNLLRFPLNGDGGESEPPTPTTPTDTAFENGTWPVYRLEHPRPRPDTPKQPDVHNRETLNITEHP